MSVYRTNGPLVYSTGSVPRRSTSASSREAKEKDSDAVKDDSEIIFPPNHLMR